MTDVRIERHGDALACVTPYNAAFVAAARQLAGKWSANDSAWIFPASQEERVRNLCREVYGTDGSPVAPATLRVQFPEELRAHTGPVVIAGRTVARAFGRDSGAWLGDGVVLLEGGVGSGGSGRNWETVIEAGTSLEILDVPLPLAERLAREGPGETPRGTLWGDAPWQAMVFTLAEVPAEAPEAALVAERQRLLGQRDELDRRLGEIAAELAAIAASPPGTDGREGTTTRLAGRGAAC